MVMEAMKMQTTIYAPTTGKLTEKLFNVSQSVEPKDLLVVISAG
jgi:biotin carboxyl carrier protein